MVTAIVVEKKKLFVAKAIKKVGGGVGTIYLASIPHPTA